MRHSYIDNLDFFHIVNVVLLSFEVFVTLSKVYDFKLSM
jgi:hypothetical protein